MRRRLVISLTAILLLSGIAFLNVQETTAKADDSDAYVGTWQGTWAGGSSGKFEMTIAKGAGGKLSGSISPQPNDGEGYTVPFKSVDVASGKLTAKLEDPSGEAEITLAGSAEGKTAKGTYSVKQKSDGNEVDAGSWTATKK